MLAILRENAACVEEAAGILWRRTRSTKTSLSLRNGNCYCMFDDIKINSGPKGYRCCCSTGLMLTKNIAGVSLDPLTGCSRYFLQSRGELLLPAEAQGREVLLRDFLLLVSLINHTHTPIRKTLSMFSSVSRPSASDGGKLLYTPGRLASHL